MQQVQAMKTTAVKRFQAYLETAVMSDRQPKQVEPGRTALISLHKLSCKLLNLTGVKVSRV